MYNKVSQLLAHRNTDRRKFFYNMTSKSIEKLWAKDDQLYMNDFIGRSGEQQIGVLFDATDDNKNVFKRTSRGNRFIDVLTDSGVAIEVKTGLGQSAKSQKVQIDKDYELMNTQGSGVKEVLWVFVKNPQTGKSGPRPSVAAYLKSKGIPWIVIDG